MDTETTLLESGEPPPFEVINPDSTSRIVLVCDHASNRIPLALNELGLPHAARQRHIAWDMGAGKLTRYLARRMGVPAVLAGYSRLVMDVNRQPHVPEAFPEVSDFTLVPGNQGLSDSDKALRKAALFDPYHAAIDAQLNAVQARGEIPALVAIHSYTRELLMGGGERPWHIGVLYEKDVRIARRLLDYLARQPEVEAGDNYPYSGSHPHDFTIDHHGEHRRLACCGIEVRQDLLATRESFAHWAALLGDALEAALNDEAIYSLRTGQEPTTA